MTKIDTPYKQDLVNPTRLNKKDVEQANKQQRLVAKSEPESHDLPFIDERFEVLEHIGSGGMGNVYKVSERETGSILAVKVLRSDLAVDQSSFKRFNLEVEATKGLTHPNLVPTLAQGMTADGSPYLVMEYVEGKDLSHVLKNERHLTSNRILEILKQTCEALAYAHENGIIHRDIKPTNIILSRNESGAETTRLVDFGIAKLLSAQTRETHNLTETGAVFGNPYYMSPEHCLSLKMDERSDVYSLGCLIYELCTGGTPFAEPNPVHVVVKHIHESAAPFKAEFRTDAIREKLSDVALRCLEKDPALRYQSVKELAKDLELVAEGRKPAKYAKKKIARPEFTRAQIFAGIIGVALVIQSRAMTGGWSDHLFVVAVLSLLGGLAFSYASLEQVKFLFKGQITPRNCWRAALFLSIAFMSWCSLPDNLYLLYAEQMKWMTPYTQVVALSAKLAVLFSVISGIGCLAFRSTLRTAAWKVSTQFVGVLCTVVLVSSAVFPSWTSGELTHFCTLGKRVETVAPWLTDSLLRYAIVLDSSNSTAVSKLARSLANQGNETAAISILDSYIKTQTSKEGLAEAYFKKALLYKEPSTSKLKALDMAIQLSPSRLYFEKRADLKAEMGMYEEALKDYDNAIHSQPGAVTPFCGKALVYASQKKYETAVRELDQLAKMEDTQIAVFFLRGLLREKLNDPSSSEDFQRIAQCDSNQKKKSQDGLSICELKVLTAHAYKHLNDNANFALKLQEAKSYSYGDFEKYYAEIQSRFKRAKLEL